MPPSRTVPHLGSQLVDGSRAITPASHWRSGCSPGIAGSNTAADHIAVLTEALGQIPARHRRDVLVTVDGAGATRDLVGLLTTLEAAPGALLGGFDLDDAPAPPSPRCPTDAGSEVGSR